MTPTFQAQLWPPPPLVGCDQAAQQRLVTGSLSEPQYVRASREGCSLGPSTRLTGASLTPPYPALHSPAPLTPGLSTRQHVTQDQEQGEPAQTAASTSPPPNLCSQWFKDTFRAICPGSKTVAMALPSLSWKWTSHCLWQIHLTTESLLLCLLKSLLGLGEGWIDSLGLADVNDYIYI